MIMNYYVPPFDARFSYNLTCLMTRLDGLLVAMTCCRCCLFKNNANLCTWNKKNTYTSYIHQPSSSLQKHIWFQLNEKKSYKYLEWNKIQKKTRYWCLLLPIPINTLTRGRQTRRDVNDFIYYMRRLYSIRVP